MPSPAWENLDDFLDTDEFAVEAVVRFQAGGQRPLVGIFDDPYLNAQLGEFDMDTSKPRFLVKEADAQGITRGDGLTLDGTRYTVMTGPKGTGDGWAVLDLAEV